MTISFLNSIITILSLLTQTQTKGLYTTKRLRNRFVY